MSILTSFLFARGQHRQAVVIDDFFNHRRDGFFVEAGAWDGVYLSNTLFFEVERNWTGLLVEANPKGFRTLETANRKAYSANVCLAPSKKPGKVTFG